MAEKRTFANIAKLIKSSRLAHPKKYSQSELSHILGYKNGQFISNVERALCNIPLKMLCKVSEVLDIPKSTLKDAILKDHDETLENFLNDDSEESAAVGSRQSGESEQGASAGTKPDSSSQVMSSPSQGYSSFSAPSKRTWN